MAVENQLASLIKANGSLVFPGLGVFTIVYQPAKIDYIQKKISPPGKFVSFIAETSSKGIDENIPVKVDDELWLKYITNISNSLLKKETVVLPGLGSIYQDFRNEIHFIPSQLNYDDSSFGLSSLHAEPITRQANLDIMPIPEAKVPIVIKKKGWKSFVSEMAFSILIGLSLLTVGFGFWYAISTKKVVQVPSKFQIAESTLENQRKLEDILDYDAKWTTPGYFDGNSTEGSEELNANNNVPKSLKPNNESLAAKEIKGLLKADALKRTYKIGVGSFSQEANAKVLLKKLTKMHLTAVNEHTGSNMIRVIVIKHCDERELKTTLSNLKLNVNSKAYLIK